MLRIDCAVEDISRDHLLSACEVFITSTAGGVMPMTKVDNKYIGSGTPGEVTQRIADAYWNMHDDESNKLVIKYATDMRALAGIFGSFERQQCQPPTADKMAYGSNGGKSVFVVRRIGLASRNLRTSKTECVLLA